MLGRHSVTRHRAYREWMVTLCPQLRFVLADSMTRKPWRQGNIVLVWRYFSRIEDFLIGQLIIRPCSKVIARFASYSGPLWTSDQRIQCLFWKSSTCRMIYWTGSSFFSFEEYRPNTRQVIYLGYWESHLQKLVAWNWDVLAQFGG